MAEFETTTWDIHTPLPFTASNLYPLAPLGVGTPFVESLTSYLKRLAHAHHLKVVDLVTFCSTQTDAHVLPSTLQKLSRIDGMTGSGQAWSILLQQLTGRDDVACLTMHFWRGQLNSGRLLRQHHAWCPACFADAAQSQTPLYEHLSWRLQCVHVCTRHQCPLVETCPTCGKQFTTLSNWAIVGCCPKCQGWLGAPAVSDQRHTDAREEYQRAEAVGRLLSFASSQHLPVWNPMAQVLPQLKQLHQTTYVHLEHVLNTSMTMLSSLLREERQPSLAVFARLAVFSGEIFWQTLTQRGDSTPVSESAPSPQAPSHSADPQTYLDHLLALPQRLPSFHSIIHQCGFADATAFRQAFPLEVDRLHQRIRIEQREVLEQALQQPTPVILSKWAQQHGYQAGDLYHPFYDLCMQVTQRFRVDKHERCRSYLEAALHNDSFPLLNDICQTLDVGDRYLKQHFADELQTIETRRRTQLERTEVWVREYLDRVLAEDDGAVSLAQVEQVVGKSAKYLKDRFPTQSAAILNRRRAYVAQQVQATCDRIRQTVFDLHERGIYPSVDRIHAVIDTWMIHGKAYRRAYIEAMTQCGYLAASSP